MEQPLPGNGQILQQLGAAVLLCSDCHPNRKPGSLDQANDIHRVGVAGSSK
jgi:hypothetical protein